MRVIRGCALAVCALGLSGCGYVGDPLPPSLHIPEPITVLAAAQTGRGIEIALMTPALNTDGLKIREFQDVEVRIGPATGGSFEAWVESSVRIPVPNEPIKPGSELRMIQPAERWQGQEIGVAARTTGHTGRPSQWSDLQRLAVLETLPAPSGVRANLAPRGVSLTWPAVQGATAYRIIRQEGLASARPALEQAGVDVQTAEYTDANVTPGSTYSYFVQARQGERASPWSQAASVKVEDTFPPPSPVGLTAVPALNSVELSWEAVASADVSGYRVYRSPGDGEWTVLADAVAVPAYSDRAVQSGQSYRYAVAAIDKSGNESTRSQAVAVQAP
jgi:hypothetical protein